jgi:hypothetical protein
MGPNLRPAERWPGQDGGAPLTTDEAEDLIRDLRLALQEATGEEDPNV